MMGTGTGAAPVLNVVVLYDPKSVHVNTTRDHLEAFGLYSSHRITYATAVQAFPTHFDLEHFDVVVIHYSVRLAYAWHMSASVRAALQAFRGPKILFIQDEYDNPDVTSAAINYLGIEAVFSCVPPNNRWAFYQRVQPHVEFHSVLTGYVSPALEAIRETPPPAQRPIVIGYRGRRLHYRYGKLGQEKHLIGERMKAICAARGIPHDIDTTEEKRIYGAAWNVFLTSCRATLGTESGSNIIDRDGSLTAKINRLLAWQPRLTFDQVFDRLLRPLEGEVEMNQISPRIFEAIASRTGLILFEGTYSGIVRPDVHYISLKKDFSNIGEVLQRVGDDRGLEAMTARAHRDVIQSGRYRYRAMVEQVDAVIARLAGNITGWQPLDAPYPMAGLVRAGSEWKLSGLFSSPIDASGLLCEPPAPQGLRGFAVQALKRRLPPRLKAWGGRLLQRVAPSRWLKLARALVLYTTSSPARRTLHAYLTRRSIRQRVGIMDLWGDLLRLDALTRAVRGGAPTERLFQLSWNLEAASARLEFVSRPTGDGDRARSGSPCPNVTPDRSDIRKMAARAGELDIVWDHSAVGAICELLVCKQWVGYRVGEAGMYRFEGLSAVSRRKPELVLQLLGPALEQQAGGQAPPADNCEGFDDVVAANGTGSSDRHRSSQSTVLGGAVRKRAG
jgi:hypothetical protein